MNKLLLLLIFLFISDFSHAQTFTQTFVDRCTGKVEVVNVNFVQNSAVVAFYNEVKVFTYTEFLNGELQSWLIEKYEWWNTVSPCSQTNQQVQQIQQTTKIISETINTTNEISNNSTPSNSTDVNLEESTNKETELENDEPVEKNDKDSETDNSEEEKKKKMNPIQLKADFMVQESLLGTYNSILNIGLSQSSIFGDVNYTANLMIWDNLKQVGASFNRSKVVLNDNYEVKWIDATTVSYMRNYKTNAVSINLNRIRPVNSWGIFGVGINFVNLFGKDSSDKRISDFYSLGWNVIYTNSFNISDKIKYSPSIIGAQSPLTIVSPIKKDLAIISKDFIGILSNSFTVYLTRRFSFNLGWSIVYNTNKFVPIINSFMIGSKLPF